MSPSEGNEIVHRLWGVDFSPDGALLVTTDDNKATLWTREGQKLADFGDYLWDVEFSPDGTLLVTIDHIKMLTYLY